LLKQSSDKVILVGNGFVDESKTNPKTNPLTGGLSYFSNERRRQFTEVTKSLCTENGIEFVDVGVSEEEWLKTYLYEDGVHPNQAGHQLIFEEVKPFLELAIR
jgi:lysophospholipase L1-like esterase